VHTLFRFGKKILFPKNPAVNSTLFSSAFLSWTWSQSSFGSLRAHDLPSLLVHSIGARGTLGHATGKQWVGTQDDELFLPRDKEDFHGEPVAAIAAQNSI
jgi:hypothetical protein